MEKKLLPIGKQDFKKLIESNCIYVDKTEHIYRLVTQGFYYFLSRPRRFGKSLLVSTVKELFEGNRPLFEGTWIEKKWDWSKTKPVIQVSFAKMPYQGLGLLQAITEELDMCAASFEIELNLNHIKDLLESMFGDLPENLYETTDRRSERFYHSLIHLTFKFLGIFIDSEVATAKGYADSVVQTPTHVYIFEFKHQ